MSTAAQRLITKNFVFCSAVQARWYTTACTWSTRWAHAFLAMICQTAGASDTPVVGESCPEFSPAALASTIRVTACFFCQCIISSHSFQTVLLSLMTHSPSVYEQPVPYFDHFNASRKDLCLLSVFSKPDLTSHWNLCSQAWSQSNGECLVEFSLV